MRGEKRRVGGDVRGEGEGRGRGGGSERWTRIIKQISAETFPLV